MKRTALMKASALAIALTVSLAAMQAGDVPTGKGGASRLVGNSSPVDTAAPGAAAVMQCPHCKDQVSVRTDYSARGATKPQVTVVTHLCDQCGSKLVRVGHGKQAVTHRVHTCAKCMKGS
jgi:predicted RNA-binding Zn-ribbon protein involved in translation (DUF1610 family)